MTPTSISYTLRICSATAVGILAFPLAGIAQIAVAYESFAYIQGDELVAKPSSGSGFGADWLSADDQDVDIIRSPLSFGNLQVGGNALSMRAPGDAQSQNLRSLVEIPNTTNNQLWISFLVQKEGTIGDKADVFTLSLLGSNDTGLFIGDFSESFFFGIGNGNPATRQYSAVAPAVGTTFLLVASISFQAGNDVIRLFVNPTPGLSAPEEVTGTGIFTGADMPSITTLDLFANNSQTWSVDEFRLGLTYASVTPTPEPGTAVLLTVAGVALLTKRRRG